MLAAATGLLHAPPILAAWLLLVAFGSYLIISDWAAFAATSQGIFAPSNFGWLFGCWLALKVVRETGHGVVCKRYGGTVREIGILFILFAPLAYVDVTSSWRFRSRWRRMHVAAAGMYLELFIAAVAAIVWSNSSAGWLNSLCFNMIVMASLTTLLFNANPLMKFDGYYLLSDFLKMPNLCVNGQAYLRYWARRYLFGVPAKLPAWRSGDGLVIRTYGWAALAWRIVVCISLTVSAATLLQGAGIALAAVAIVLWFALPALNVVNYLVLGKPGEQPSRLRFLATVGTATAAGVILFGYVPWPGVTVAPAVVEYAPFTVVRAASDGLVSTIHVESGQQVASGQLLAVLENRQLVRDLNDLKLQIRQSEIRGRQHEQKGELAARQAEAEQRAALQVQFREKQEEVTQLSVRAPRAGKVIGRGLAALLGTYLQEGDEILSLGDDSQKELRISLAQDDLEVFSNRIGEPICIDLPRQSLWYRQLGRVVPRATLTPLHPALATVNGGPLPVKPIANSKASSDSSSHELLSPRFTAIVPLSPADARQLRAGQRASISYRACTESIGQYGYGRLSRWIRERFST